MRLFSRHADRFPEGKGKGRWPWCYFALRRGRAAESGPSSGSPWGRCDTAGPAQPWGPAAGGRWRPCLARAGSTGPVTLSLRGSLVVLACMAPGTLCNEAEAWGPCGGQHQAALPSLASHFLWLHVSEASVSLSREGLVLLLVPRGPHPDAGLKQGWALMAIIPLMLSGSETKNPPFSRAFLP